MSVVTVTPSGTIDLTYRIDALCHGEFLRAESGVREVSGKGVNVAVALSAGGMDATAIVVLGSDDRSFASASPHAELLRPVFLPGQSRVSTQIVDAAGATTKINAPAPPMTGLQWRELADAIDAEVEGRAASWLVIGGSLPEVDGEAADLRQLCGRASARGVRLVMDTSGDPLRRLLEDPRGIALLKPNVHELSEALGRIPLRTVGDVIAAARVVIARGLERLYVSMGPDGALVVSRDRVVHALARPARLASSAGAGDASLAGFILGAGDGASLDLVSACATAARYGAQAVSQEATLLTRLDGLPEAETSIDPDPARVLVEPAG